MCRDRKQFRVTQAQFWQWVREGVVVKTQDQPLAGIFLLPHEELMVTLNNTVLNLAHPQPSVRSVSRVAIRLIQQVVI